MTRKKTKTSSFGTSKREGHDATQFYSSNLYNGLEINEDQEIIDQSNQLDVTFFKDPIPFSMQSLKKIPDNSLHFIIFDSSQIINRDLLEKNFETQGKILFQQLYRILITGGKVGIIIDNIEQCEEFNVYQPYHALIALELIKIGFIMRGEVIWKNQVENNLRKGTSLDTIYELILIFSKQIMKREKGTNVDTISRDQFLQFTKSIWKHDLALMNPVISNAVFDKARLDCYNRLLQLYTFETDKILLLIPTYFIQTASLLHQMRTNIILFLFDKLLI